MSSERQTPSSRLSSMNRALGPRYSTLFKDTQGVILGQREIFNHQEGRGVKLEDVSVSLATNESLLMYQGMYCRNMKSVPTLRLLTLALTFSVLLFFLSCASKKVSTPFSSKPAQRLLESLPRVQTPRHISAYLNNIYRKFSRSPSSLVLVVQSRSPLGLAVDEHLMIISDTLLKLTNSEDQLAFILAHEASHISLDHHMAQSTSQRVLELEADRLAVQKLWRAGYDPLQVHNLLLALYRDYPMSAHYPSIPDRLTALHKNHQQPMGSIREYRQYNYLRRWLDSIPAP